MEANAYVVRSCWIQCLAIQVLFALLISRTAMAVPANPYPQGFTQTPVFGRDRSQYNGRDFTLLKFQETGAQVYKIIFNYGKGGTLGSIKLTYTDSSTQTTPYASEQDPDLGDIFQPVEYAFDVGETVTKIIITANDESDSYTIVGAPGRIQIFTSKSGPDSAAVTWDQNIYNCGFFRVICSNNGFGDNLDNNPQTYTILGSGLLVGILGNAESGPRAISFLFLNPIVSSTLSDITYPNLDAAPLPVTQVDDSLLPVIQNGLLAPAASYEQMKMEQTVDSYTYTETTVKARELGYSIGTEFGGGFDIGAVKATTKLTLGTTGKWTVTTTESAAVFQSNSVTITKKVTIPAAPLGTCTRYLFGQTLGVLSQSYSGTYDLVVKTPEQSDPGVFHFPSFGVLNVQQKLELTSTARPCTPEERAVTASAANPATNGTIGPRPVAQRPQRNVSPVPEPLPGGQSTTLPHVIILPENDTCYMPITFPTAHTIATVAKELAVATYEVTTANSGVYDCPQDVVPANTTVIAPLCAPCFGLKCEESSSLMLDFNVTTAANVVKGEAQLYEACLRKQRG